MSAIDGYIESELSREDTPINEIISNVREKVDAPVASQNDIVPILLAQGLVVWDPFDRAYYARVRACVLNTLYMWSVRGLVSLTPTMARWAE